MFYYCTQYCNSVRMTCSIKNLIFTLCTMQMVRMSSAQDDPTGTPWMTWHDRLRCQICQLSVCLSSSRLCFLCTLLCSLLISNMSLATADGQHDGLCLSDSLSIIFYSFFHYRASACTVRCCFSKSVRLSVCHTLLLYLKECTVRLTLSTIF